MKLSTRKIPRYVAIFAILACVVVSIVHLVKLFLPMPLQHADIYHLIRLYTDVQAIPVDSEVDSGDTTMITIKVDEEMIKTHLKNTWIVPDQTKYEKDPVLKKFLPLTSADERTNLLVLLETFVRVCEQEKLSYFFFSGSLLGVYRHHGFIPWDDDIDLVMNISDWRRIRNVLSRVQGYVLYTPSDSHWKFYKIGSKAVPEQPFLWPFVDIFFFTADSTHIWALSGSIKNELINPKDDIFPLQLRPFEYLQVRVPCKMEKMVHRLFNMEYCQSPIFGHKDAVWFKSTEYIPCKKLHNMLPFVFRQKDEISGIIFETLKRGDEILRNVSVSQSCKAQR